MLPLILAFSFTTVQHWITTRGFTGGVIVVFCLLFACGLGLPLPEDIPLIIAGAFLATDARSWVIVGVAAWLGIIGGDCVLYFMGRRYGMEIQRAPLIGKHVTKERIQHVEKLFDKYGVGVVGIGRLFAGIRGAVVICAGAIRFNFVKFIIVDGLAAVVSGGLFMLLGHWIGEKLNDPAAQKKIHDFKEVFIGGGVVLALLFVGYVLWRKRHRGELQVVEEKVLGKVVAAEKRVADTIVHTAEKIVGKPPHETGSSAPQDDAPPTPPELEPPIPTPAAATPPAPAAEPVAEREVSSEPSRVGARRTMLLVLIVCAVIVTIVRVVKRV